MSFKQSILLSLMLLAMGALFLLIIFGSKGLADLQELRADRNALVAENERLAKENLALYHEIERLKNDSAYIENIARKELGMVAKGEVVFKVPNPSSTGSTNKK
jgi:cell division protein FtsB